VNGRGPAYESGIDSVRQSCMAITTNQDHADRVLLQGLEVYGALEKRYGRQPRCSEIIDHCVILGAVACTLIAQALEQSGGNKKAPEKVSPGG